MSTVASFPLDEFSLPSGGIILKSSDGVEFKVYKNILSLASPFFSQMFTLPQPIDSGDSETQTTDENKNNNEQIFSVSESSSPLDMLLRLVHPIAPPVLPGRSEAGHVTDVTALINAIEPVLAAALKYDIPLIVRDLCSILLDAAEVTLPDGNVVNDTLAVRVYILACRHKLKDEARRAAHAALKGRVYGVFVEELRYINAAHYFRLIQFHTTIVLKMRDLVKHDNSPKPFFSDSCSVCCGKKNQDVWNIYVDNALTILAESPRSSKAFSPVYGDEFMRMFGGCTCVTLENWDTACQKIQEEIETAVSKNDIDLSEI